MNEQNKLIYNISAEDFTSAGKASSDVQQKLKEMGISHELVRRVSLAMYECEVNMIIHADGGEIEVTVLSDEIQVVASDKGSGIADVELALSGGYSTASQEARSMGYGAGLGFTRMQSYSDSLKVDTKKGKGTTVQMIFYKNSNIYT